jgi:hypothetical protein
MKDYKSMRKSSTTGNAEAWSILEVEMDEKHRTFTVKRRLERVQLSDPSLKPTFIFYTSRGAQLMVNNYGCFILRWKKPKYLAGKKVQTKSELSKKLLYVEAGVQPKLSRLPSKSPLARLAKKSMKQLFASGKITKE